MRIDSMAIDIALRSIAAVAWNNDNVVLELSGGKHVTLRRDTCSQEITRVKKYMEMLQIKENRFIYGDGPVVWDSYLNLRTNMAYTQ